MPTAPKPTLRQRARQRTGWQHDSIRGNATQRGYDNAWRKLSKAYRNQHPLCESCLKRGVVTDSDHTDHIIEFRGLNDPLRLDWDNLQALCERCHMRKTGEAGRIGRPGAKG